jgi:Fur family transcriptional regulator, ferric uptake regulator
MMTVASPEPGEAEKEASRWVATTEAALRRAGGRSTAARRGILGLLDAADGGMSAEELLLALGAAGLPAARSTVYRTLDTLREIGAVETVHPDPEHHRYLARRSAHQHHLVCEICGTVTTFDGCDLEDEVIAAAVATGFRVRRHTLEILGSCAECGPSDLEAEAAAV